MTRAEKRALLALLVIAAGFLPPVTLVTGRPEPFLFGLPFNFLWLLVMMLVTVVALSLAFRHVARADGFPDEQPIDTDSGDEQP